MATPLLWTRQADTIGVLGLALNTCAERDGYVEERERIAELLDTARDLWRTLPEAEDEAEARGLDARDLPAHPPRRHPGGDGRR